MGLDGSTHLQPKPIYGISDIAQINESGLFLPPLQHTMLECQMSVHL